MRYQTASTENSYLQISRVSKHDVALNTETNSEDETRRKRCRRYLYKKKRNSGLVLSDKEFQTLSGEYEYVIEKLNIVKVPLLICATQEDVDERLSRMATRAPTKLQMKSNDSQVQENNSSMYNSSHFSDSSFSDIFDPIFSEMFHRRQGSDVAEISNLQEDMFNESSYSERIRTLPETMKICLSKETISSNYALIPRQRKDTTGRVPEEIITNSKYSRDRFERPEYLKERNESERLLTLETKRHQQNGTSKYFQDERETLVSFDFESLPRKKLPGFKSYQLVPTYQQDAKSNLKHQMFHPNHLTHDGRQLSCSDNTAKHRKKKDSKAASITSFDGISERFKNSNMWSEEECALSGTFGYEPSETATQATALKSSQVPASEYANKPQFRMRRQGLESESRSVQTIEEGYLGFDNYQAFSRTPSPKFDKIFLSRYFYPKQNDDTTTQPCTSGVAVPLPPTHQTEMFDQIDISEPKKSSSEGSIIFKKTPKHLFYSRKFDILLEEDKPRTTENALREHSYIKIVNKSVPEMKVHEKLNKYSSIFIDNLKERIPKDPLTMQREEIIQPPSSSLQAQVIMKPPPSQSPSNHVLLHTERPRSSCNQRRSVAKDSHTSVCTAEYAEKSSNYIYPKHIPVNEGKKTNRKPKRKISGPKKLREIFKQNTASNIGFGHSHTTSKQMSTDLGRRNSSQRRNVIHDDSQPLKLSNLHLSPEMEPITSDLTQELHSDYQKHAYHVRGGGQTAFDSLRSQSIMRRNYIRPVHEPVSSRQSHAQHSTQNNGQKSNQSPRTEYISTETNSLNSDSENTRIIKT